MKIPNKIKGIMQKLIDNDFEAYIIGGAVRDSLLGIEPHDYDIFTNATGKQILFIFSHGKILGGEDRQQKILTVIVDGVEVSQYRKNGNRTETGTSFEDHISTCDLTINAIACDIDERIIDLVEGMSHLERKLICFVGNSKDRITEDPLRILRAIRFYCKYNFLLGGDSYYIIQENLNLLNKLPEERILEELKRILQYPDSIDILKEIGILSYLFPEFELIYDMPGGEKHGETVFQHLNESFKATCSVTDDFKLKSAVLFHDIGKSSKYELRCDDDKKDMSGIITTTFYGHEEEGERVFLKYAEKYKFSNDETKFIAFLIRNHMFGYQLENITNNTLIKFFNKMESAGVTIMDFVTMLYCDNQGNLAKPRIKFKDFIENNFFYNKYIQLKKTKPFKITDLEINGNDLMKLCYVGKDIGTKLNELYEMVLDGKIINRKDRLMEELLK